MQFGSSREIVRALLMHDLDEEVKAFKHRLMLPQKIPERVSARDRQNGLGQSFLLRLPAEAQRD